MKLQRVSRLWYRAGVTYAEPRGGQAFELLDGSPFDRLSRTGVVVAMADVRLLPPVAPSKVLGIGVNYLGGDAPPDAERPAFFLMPPSALAASGDTRAPARHVSRGGSGSGASGGDRPDNWREGVMDHVHAVRVQRADGLANVEFAHRSSGAAKPSTRGGGGRPEVV